MTTHEVIADASKAAAAAAATTATSAKPAPVEEPAADGPPPPKPKPGKIRRYLRNTGRTIALLLIGGLGYMGYVIYSSRHPPVQFEQDPSKKNLVILGSGWGATSLLKSLDTEGYNVIVVSPRNYFLFTPLLPSCTTGTIELRSIMEPIRYITRHKKAAVKFYEADCEEIDPINKTIKIADHSEIKGTIDHETIPYDYLVVAVGSENQTFGIKGVKEHACFLKEIWDAQKIRTRIMDCMETAAFAGQSEEEIERLLHMVVVGGGPTGVEYAGELHDFLVEDLSEWYPDLADKVKITLVEALPNVLPTFSKQLIEYTESTFKANRINVLTKTMVKEVGDKHITVQDADKSTRNLPYGLLVWATGNTLRPVTRSLIDKLTDVQTNKRGLLVDDYLNVLGAPGVFGIGDATATKYAPTAQAASQQGKYLARILNANAKVEALQQDLDEMQAKMQGPGAGDAELTRAAEAKYKQLQKASRMRPFEYSHQGSLAYIGSDKAIADLPFFNGNLATGGVATFLFWRSAYISTLFSLRNRSLVILDWIKVRLFGRDVSRE